MTSSSLSAYYSSLAQSVERMTVNHDVAGSSPAGEPIIDKIPASLVDFTYCLFFTIP